MDKKQEAYFDSLSENRAETAKALEGFALRGVKNSVVEKYSDQAHFIYELLQNADDANATTARFELYKDKLIFAHNGTRRFTVSNPATEEQDHKNNTLGDINAITAVGSSNKTGEATIGKFGIGFKAVFQYTATPHIYGPDVFFKIERFIVPIRLDKDYAGRRKDETMFVFPFDHEARTAENAFEDISKKLRSLDYPILFLSNLKDVSFEISGVFGLYGKAVEERLHFDKTVAEYIRLTQNDGESQEDLYDNLLWLFSRNDENGHTYSVGFSVNAEGHLLANRHTAFCFFPTKERTGLNFIVHAPFLLTDSRENIRAGAQYNKDMIFLLADLAADSLNFLKEIGKKKGTAFIDDNIFDIIPYDENNFSETNDMNSISFKPFYTLIKERFSKESLLPSADGYVSSENAYWAFVPQIAALFSNEQLAALCKNENAKWVFTSFGRQDTLRKNKALTEYIDSITNVWLNDEDILSGWSYKNGASHSGISAEFIEAQSIEWLHRFYKWISETANRTKIVKAKPIFLNQDKKAVAAFDTRGQAILFLPSEGGSGYDTINPDLLKNKETATFIKQLGITVPSLKNEVYNKILPLYKDGVAIATRPHFKKFFEYYKECSQSEAKSFIALIKEYKFILYQSESDKTKYRGKGDTLYFPNETLIKWFQAKPDTNFVSFDEYLQLVGKDNKEELVSFLSDLGVKDEPRILTRELGYEEAYRIRSDWKHSTHGQSWTEKYIDGCKEIIEKLIQTHDSELSLVVWNQLLKFVEYGYSYNSLRSVMCGKYEYFYYSQQSQSFDSREAILLHTQPWLINSDGEFKPAGSLTVQTLSPQFNTSDDDVVELIRLLGIGDVVDGDNDNENLTDEQKAKIEFADAYADVPPEVLAQAAGEYRAKKNAVNPDIDDDGGNAGDSGATPVSPSVSRIVKEISKRASSVPKERITSHLDDVGNTPVTDEDDYSKPTVDIGKKIEKVKEQAEQDIRKIAQLEDLKQQAQNANKYSYAWVKALLELESLNSSDNTANSREISIIFSKVQREEGTSRTLILKHPNRYIPQSMEDLADIPLELYFTNQPMIKVAVEVVNVKSYTLRAKLRTNAQIDGVDLSLVTEAKIEAKNPVFLIEELRKAFNRLGDDNSYNDNYDMQNNLCENIKFIFGPPGTGKTTYLARNVILPLMRETEDLKVLVLTPTNKAADVLVRRLMESMDADHSYLNWLIRFGTTNDIAIEQSGVFRDKTFDVRSFPRNVTITTIARFPYDYFFPNDTRLHLNALKWDYIIIDEASMIPLANIVYPLYKKTPKEFIIAGDPFQIEPITTVNLWKGENIYTMVGLKSFTEPKTVPHPYHVKLLTTQYRSIPEIGEVFSKFAYGGVLKHNRTEESWKPLPIGDFIDVKPLNIIKVPVSKYESIYRPKRLQNKSTYQIYSAIFAFEFVRGLSSLIELTEKDELFRIGLIAPYRAQSDLIDKMMTSVPFPKNIEVQVGTIHGFQGDECDIIIDLFNPPPTISDSKEMFLNKLNIINVSISRARDYLFVIMPDDDTENVGNLTLVKRVEKLFKEQPDWKEWQSSEIEELIFGSKTYIEDNSFSTSHQLVNVYGKPEQRYEIRSEDNAVDVQIHE